jgi:hypothetical protein
MFEVSKMGNLGDGDGELISPFAKMGFVVNYPDDWVCGLEPAVDV